MLLDTIHGTIERRILLNYRIEAAALQKVLPAPFRPKLFRGWGIGGVCMIRFQGLRPRLAPRWLGLGSENAAHRFAVEWQQDGENREGVFIPRRDTNSWFNKTLGGRVFPGIFQKSRFESSETGEDISLRVVRSDGGAEICFRGHPAVALPSTSVFDSLQQAAQFFALGATGYSATRTAGHFHGMDLHSENWEISPLAIDAAQSCFFDGAARFPPGTIELDCALLMRNIAHQWRSQPDLFFSAQTNQLTTSS